MMSLPQRLGHSVRLTHSVHLILLTSSDFTDIIQNFLLYSMRHHIEYLYIATISRQYSVLSGMFDLMDTDRNKVKRRDCGQQQHVYYATLCVAQGDCNCWGKGFSLKISVSDSLLWLFLGGKNVITHVFFFKVYKVFKMA